MPVPFPLESVDDVARLDAWRDAKRPRMQVEPGLRRQHTMGECHGRRRRQHQAAQSLITLFSSEAKR